MPPNPEPVWPAAAGRPVAFLVDASSSLEWRMLGEWIDEHRPAGAEYAVVAIPPSRRRRFRRDVGGPLRELVGGAGDPLLVPLRIAWLGPRREGRRVPRLLDLVAMGDPRDPNRVVQELFVRFRPDRIRVVVGDAATLSEVRARWVEARTSRPDDPHGLAEYVALQGALALEVAERRIRGNRYKVPRMLFEDLLDSTSFATGLAEVADETGETVEDLRTKAGRYLKEIAARPSTFVLDLVAALIRLIYTMGYERRINYDAEALERIAELGQRHSLAFMPSHKSNMDHLALTYVLYENGLPPNHAAGGINMNFFPVGPFLRRHGIFFIRRSFKDNAAYKFTLQRYLDYLLEKRFPLEWYMEGGRSRSGKLRSPRYGILSYVVDSWRRGSCEDVYLIPTSIAYDQIQDVFAHAAEQRGAAKEKESFAWLVRVLRTLRRRYGRIYLNFGEPVSLAAALGRAEEGVVRDPEDDDLEVRKLAFEVAVRINRVTPITPISLVTMAMLGAGDRALTVDETMEALRDLVGYVERRGFPVTERVDLEDPSVVRAALDALVDHGVLSRVDGGRQVVYSIGPDQHLAAAFYRNTIIHFFLTGAIAELGLADAMHAAEPMAVFWDRVASTRDALKFEFFFPEREAFIAEVAAELEASVPGWEGMVAGGRAGDVLRGLEIGSTRPVLEPILEAYVVLGDALVDVDPRSDADPKELTQRALSLGRQYIAQRVIASPEAVSTALFDTAIGLARNRGLLVGGGVERLEERLTFAREMRELLDLMSRASDARA